MRRIRSQNILNEILKLRRWMHSYRTMSRSFIPGFIWNPSRPITSDEIRRMNIAYSIIIDLQDVTPDQWRYWDVPS